MRPGILGKGKLAFTGYTEISTHKHIPGNGYLNKILEEEYKHFEK